MRTMLCLAVRVLSTLAWGKNLYQNHSVAKEMFDQTD